MSFSLQPGRVLNFTDRGCALSQGVCGGVALGLGRMSASTLNFPSSYKVGIVFKSKNEVASPSFFFFLPARNVIVDSTVYAKH